MTVSELKKFLNTLPDNVYVVIAPTESEGNVLLHEIAHAQTIDNSYVELRAAE